MEVPDSGNRVYTAPTNSSPRASAAASGLPEHSAVSQGMTACDTSLPVMLTMEMTPPTWSPRGRRANAG
jgi:hypothetical protein